jgi:hypothetical protein
MIQTGGITVQIHIPGDAEQLLRRNAARAGFDDVRDYVLRLIMQDDERLATVLPASDDPRIAKALADGYASGEAGEITPEFWAARREALEQRIADREKSS